MPGYVYILKTANGRFYIGSTNNLDRRINEHQLGQERYTKHILPVKLIFSQEFDSLFTARKCEKWLKKQKSSQLIQSVLSDGKIRKHL